MTPTGVIMKICKECEKEFQEKVSFEKYCSRLCCSKNNQRKISEKFKNDPELRKKKTEYERQRNAKVGRRRDRIKHNAEEKERYRKKNGINSDSDLRCAPKGSGTLTKHGYRQIIKHGHPNCRKNGDMFEHVFIMSEHIGRPLIKGETVHHKNGIREDNRIENLEIWHRSQPPGQRLNEKIEWCKEFLANYGYDVVQRK